MLFTHLWPQGQKKQMLSVISVFSQWYLLEKLENLQPEIADHAKYIWYTSTLVHSQMSKILAEEVNFLQKWAGGGGEGFKFKVNFHQSFKKSE